VFYNEPYNTEKGALTMKMNAIANKGPEENTQGETPQRLIERINAILGQANESELDLILRFSKTVTGLSK